MTLSEKMSNFPSSDRKWLLSRRADGKLLELRTKRQNSGSSYKHMSSRSSDTPSSVTKLGME